MNPIQYMDIEFENDQLKSEIGLAIEEVISTNDFVLGNAVSHFEVGLATFLGANYVIGVGNGTDALQIAILALGLKPGDEIILPSFTYFATAESVAFLGMVPVFVDVDLETYTIQPDCVERAITENTKAIIPVHIYGNPCNMDAIMLIAKRNNLFVIEDAAQAIGASLNIDDKIKHVSSIGDIGCFSFYPAKNLGAFGDAGAIVTNNKFLAQKARSLANHGQSKRYLHDVVGLNSRLDSIQAAVLNVKLKYLEIANNKRNSIAEHYSAKLQVCKQVQVPIIKKGAIHVFHQYTIIVKDNQRDQLKDYLEQCGIPTRLNYPFLVHKQDALRKIAIIPYELENTERIQNSMLSLPMHTNLDLIQIKFISNQIFNFFNKIKQE